MNLGAMYHMNNKLKEAEKSYMRALELKPGDRITTDNLSKLRNLLKSQGWSNEEEWLKRWLAKDLLVQKIICSLPNVKCPIFLLDYHIFTNHGLRNTGFHIDFIISSLGFGSVKSTQLGRDKWCIYSWSQYSHWSQS